MAALFALVLVVPVVTIPGVGGATLWTLVDPRPLSQEAKHQAMDSGGNVVVAGYVDEPGARDWQVTKHSVDGTSVRWRQTNGSAGHDDYLAGVVVDGADDVVVAGDTWGGTGFDFLTVKFAAADGAIVWQRSVNGSANGTDRATAVTADASRNVYVAGYSQTAAGPDDLLLQKYSAAGAPLWQRTYDGTAAGHDRAAAVAVGAAGVVVAGESQNAAGVFELVVIAWTIDGVRRWEARRPLGGDSLGELVRQDAGGDVVVAGTYANGVNRDFHVTKLSGATGSVVWTVSRDDGYDEVVRDLELDAAGDVYVTGYAFDPATASDVLTVRYDHATGEVRWSSTYNSVNGNADRGVALVLAPAADAVFVAGDSFDEASGYYDFVVLKYVSSTGGEAWARRWGGVAGRNDRAVGVGLTPVGSVVVAGFADAAASGASDLDVALVSLDPGSLNRPTALWAAVDTALEVRLTWVDNSDNETGFKVERRAGTSGSFVEVATLAAQRATYTDTGIAPDSDYTYRVRAYLGAGTYSDYSNEAHAATSEAVLGAPEWTFVYDALQNGGDDLGVGIATGPDNRPVAVASSYSTLGQFDYLTVKVDGSDPQILWEARYNGDQDGSDLPATVTVGAGGGVVVSGFSYLYSFPGGDSNDIYTLAYDGSTGARVWGRQYNGPAGDDDRSVAVAVAADPTGGFIVVGYGRNAAWDDDVYVLRLSDSGALLWEATPYDRGAHGNDQPTAVATSPAGDVFVVGRSANGVDDDWFAARYDGATGIRGWTDILATAGGGEDCAMAVALGPSASVYVAGVSASASGTADFYVVKYDGASGTRLWERSYGAPSGGDDRATALLVDPVSFDAVVVGTVTAAVQDRDWHLRRYDTDGTLLWQNTFVRSSHDDVVHGAAMDLSGRVVLAGDTHGGLHSDAMGVRYDEHGRFIDGVVYDGSAGGEDRAAGVAVNALGEAFVVGTTTSAVGDYDLLLLKLANDLLEVPTQLVLTPSYTTVAVTWVDNSTSESGYQLERKSGDCSSGGAWAVVATTAANAVSATDSGRYTSALYCYRLRAFKAGGETSRWVVAATMTLAPAAPGSVTASAPDTTQVRLDWTDNTDGEEGFRIERCTGPGCTSFSYLATAAANATRYVDTSICNGTTYRYQVQAFNGTDWSSPYGGPAAATSAAPLPPVLLAVTRGYEDRINLTWQDTTVDETGFRIERCLGSSCVDFAEIAVAAANATSFVNTGLQPNSTYRYRLRATKAASCGWDTGYSGQAEAVTTVAGPTNVAVTPVGTTRIDLTWTDNTATESEYRIERCEAAACSAFAPVATLGANSWRYSDTGVCAATTYRYRVVAARTVTTTWTVTSAPSADVSLPAIAAPTTLVATAVTESEISLAWSDTNADESYVEIQRCRAGDCPAFGQLTTVGTNIVTYRDTDLEVSTSYTYRVRSVKAAACGWTTAFSNEAAATTLTPPAPSALRATPVNTTTVNLEWVDRTGAETVFTVQRCAGDPCAVDAAGNVVLAAAANTQLLVDTGVCAGTTYHYWIRAEKNTAPTWLTAWTGPVTVTTPVPTVPSALVATRANESNIGLAWVDTNSDESGFTLERCETATCQTLGFAPIATVVGGIGAYADLQVDLDTSYSYRARAFKTAACVWPTAYSNTAIAATGLPGVPTTLTVAPASTTELRLGFGDVTGSETGFGIERVDGDSCDFSGGVAVMNAPANATAYVDATACEGRTYCYRIRAERGAAPYWITDWSAAAYATTPRSTAPTGVTARVVSDVATAIAWSHTPSDASGYRIERCSGADCTLFSEVGLEPTTARNHVDGGLTAETSYRYRVAAYKTAVCGWSTPSADVGIVTASGAPASLIATAVGAMAVRLEWQDFASVEDGFEVERQLWHGGFARIAGVGPNMVGHTDTLGLEPEHTYVYRVRSHRGGDYSRYSAQALVTTWAFALGEDTCR
ncbi:MAG: hypothetical protein HY903_07595 [Deltaproteobacteria bacterium]|nr:hypothetical protein [Deltaproteobacteria bacterium]